MLEEKIYDDYVEALRSKDKHKVNFLSFIRSELKNQAINLKKESLEDDIVLSVLKKQQKCLLDTKESIVSSKREDLLMDLEKELSILTEYLPKALKDDELVQIIENVIAEVEASSIKDMGKVMKKVLAKAGVRANSKKISNLVKEKLSS